MRQRKLANRLMRFSIGKFIYKIRRPNKELRALLVQLDQAGHTITIISFMPEVYRQEVETWLVCHAIPFHTVLLPILGEDEISFRVRAIQETGCHIYVDDDGQNIETLALLVSAKVIQFKDATLDVSDLL